MAEWLFGIEFVLFDPDKALFWSAVMNGIVAVPIMIAMMMVFSSNKQIKEFTAPLAMRICGWAATCVRGVAVAAMLIA
ncbi:hypothetical protein [Rhizobium wenxiniae]|uniref:hypothetical protein n=1 Tax=Rhizobium wenxiniae TaxID=1737357 RepID=UPI003C214F15